MKRIFTFCLLSLLCAAGARAQNIDLNRSVNWIFGNMSGFRFMGYADSVGGNELRLIQPYYGFVNKEGVTSISNRAGKLLFYSDGSNVYDGTHQRMTNGDQLNGSFSATQGCLPIPMPGHPNLYYLFTTCHRNAGPGIQYTVIDMSLKGGRGDIVELNHDLDCIAEEKLAAVQHANGLDYWVVTRKFHTNKMYAFLVTAEGVQAPVVTEIGVAEPGAPGFGMDWDWEAVRHYGHS